MGERTDALEKAVSAFETLAKQHLERAGWSKSWNQKFLEDTAKEVSKMKEKLKGCDVNAEAFAKENKSKYDAEVEKRLAAQLQYFAQSAAAFEALVSTFIPLLNKKIEEQKKLRDKPMPDLLAASVVRGLKILKTSLDAIAKANDQWHANSKSVAESLGKQLDQMASIAKNFLSSLKAEVAKALAAAQRVKADPTPDTYNAEMYKAGRNVTQIIGNIPKLTAKGYALPPSIPANYAQLGQPLVPFGNGNLASVPKTATAATILANIKTFNQAIKAVKAGFGV